MASKQLRKDVAKKKKDELVSFIREHMEKEFEALPAQDYAAIYELEYNRRERDTDEIFARVAFNKNLEMLAKLKKKPLEDLYIAYLEIRESEFKGPATEADPKLPD